jgi:hypothetical protein
MQFHGLNRIGIQPIKPFLFGWIHAEWFPAGRRKEIAHQRMRFFQCLLAMAQASVRRAIVAASDGSLESDFA